MLDEQATNGDANSLSVCLLSELDPNTGDTALLINLGACDTRDSEKPFAEGLLAQRFSHHDLPQNRCWRRRHSRYETSSSEVSGTVGSPCAVAIRHDEYARSGLGKKGGRRHQERGETASKVRVASSHSRGRLITVLISSHEIMERS